MTAVALSGSVAVAGVLCEDLGALPSALGEDLLRVEFGLLDDRDGRQLFSWWWRRSFYL